jgi:c-di-AMP phosphodiesterase-like protein
MKPLNLLDRLIFKFLYLIKENFFNKFFLYILLIDILTVVITGSFDQYVIALYLIGFFLLSTEYFFINEDFKNEFERYERYLNLKEKRKLK